MSFYTKAYALLAATTGSTAVIAVAVNHDVIQGALFVGTAVGLSIASINGTIKEAFGSAKKEISQEIKPAEAGSPVREAPKPALNS